MTLFTVRSSLVEPTVASLIQLPLLLKSSHHHNSFPPVADLARPRRQPARCELPASNDCRDHRDYSASDNQPDRRKGHAERTLGFEPLPSNLCRSFRLSVLLIQALSGDRDDARYAGLLSPRAVPQ